MAAALFHAVAESVAVCWVVAFPRVKTDVADNVIRCAVIALIVRLTMSICATLVEFILRHFLTPFPCFQQTSPSGLFYGKYRGY